MIQSLYQLTNKGSLRALSFILAIILTISIFTHTEFFALNLGGISPIYTLIIFWSVATLWIHGFGLELYRTIWKLLFLPLIAYFVAVLTLGMIYFFV
ncbi:cyd operon YbgE family protein [Gallibacterium melopsittaci]|uniref:Cyd operon YbgE family protein n=1 Tax=Gallibacterium melopsittaci TaxID=516063 RepID=A0ABV6HVM9_9PAST